MASRMQNDFAGGAAEMVSAPGRERLQRASGSVHVGVRLGAQGSALCSLHQAGCLKARFPRRHGPALEAVLMNSSGGIADGDALAVSLDAGAGSTLTITTPSAERIYRARPGAPPACIDTQLLVGEGARLDYLPQETIFFDGCALDRHLRIDLHPLACFLGVEARVFGRALSGETLRRVSVTDTMVLRRDGRLVLHDALRLKGDVTQVLGASAGAGGMRAMATILYAGADAQARLMPLRDALAGADGGASAWDGMVVARLVAADGQALRRLVLAALAVLREDPLPRLWAS
jgi:urease accessory protein